MRDTFLVAAVLLLVYPVVAQQPLAVEKDMRSEWTMYRDDAYVAIGEKDSDIANTIYFSFEPGKFPGRFLALGASRPFFVFFNGNLAGEYEREVSFKVDSLGGAYYTRSLLVAIHQQNINSRDLKTRLLSAPKKAEALISPARPSTYFKDFVIIAGLVVIIVFLVISRLNPKLASDYFSIIRIFSLREGDDAQSNARLTSSTNIQFYISCSLLLGFYLMIIFQHLPDKYALPLYFQGDSFGAVVWQWLRLSTVILGVFFLKILFIFSLTRLFGLRGLARIHFFNWMRLLLIVFGGASMILFVYFILRGQSPGFFAMFLSLIVATLTAWVVVAFLKLNGKSEHSMFHLFSYICATEIIPLLITIKVLFQ